MTMGSLGIVRSTTHLPFPQVQLEHDRVWGFQPLVIVVHHAILDEAEAFVEGDGLRVRGVHVEVGVLDERIRGSLVQRVSQQPGAYRPVPVRSVHPDRHQVEPSCRLHRRELQPARDGAHELIADVRQLRHPPGGGALLVKLILRGGFGTSVEGERCASEWACYLREAMMACGGADAPSIVWGTRWS